MSSGVFEFALSLFKGFMVGNCVLAILLYLEYWMKRQQHAKQLAHKKRILDQMQAQEKDRTE